MVTVFTIFLTVTVFFFILLAIKSMAKKQFCVLCASVSITWILLLALHFYSGDVDEVLLALLMGQSTVGIYYLLENRVHSRWHVFRLPLLLTLTLGAYVLIRGSAHVTGVLLLIGALWAGIATVKTFQKQEKIGQFVKKLIECCKNW